MSFIQKLAISVLCAMILYLIYINVFEDHTVKSAGAIKDILPSSFKTAETGGVKEEVKVKEEAEVSVTNKLPEHPDASLHAGSSVFNPHTTGILPQNQDIFEKQANFGSDVTNIKQFYQNNPEVFGKILGQNEVTNVSDWERQSKEMFQTAQQKPAGPIQAANFEDNFSPL
jgi:hypothetical protein